MYFFITKYCTCTTWELFKLIYLLCKVNNSKPKQPCISQSKFWTAFSAFLYRIVRLSSLARKIQYCLQLSRACCCPNCWNPQPQHLWIGSVLKDRFWESSHPLLCSNPTNSRWTSDVPEWHPSSPRAIEQICRNSTQVSRIGVPHAYLQNKWVVLDRYFLGCIGRPPEPSYPHGSTLRSRQGIPVFLTR